MPCPRCGNTTFAIVEGYVTPVVQPDLHNLHLMVLPFHPWRRYAIVAVSSSYHAAGRFSSTLPPAKRSQLNERS